MVKVIEMVRKIINKTGWDLHHYRPGLKEARIRLIGAKKIDLVLDVGASIGAFTAQLRRDGYGGPVVSFEPVLKSFQNLSKNSEKDPLWQSYQLLLGPKEGKTIVNVGDKTYTSSVLEYGLEYKTINPGLRSVPQEALMVRLDKWTERNRLLENQMFIKLDVQGYEREVLEGAAGMLRNVQMIQIELSLVELYSGGWLLPEAVAWFAKNGFKLYQIERVFEDYKHARLLQLDGLFVRT